MPTPTPTPTPTLTLRAASTFSNPRQMDVSPTTPSDLEAGRDVFFNQNASSGNGQAFLLQQAHTEPQKPTLMQRIQQHPAIQELKTAAGFGVVTAILAAAGAITASVLTGLSVKSLVLIGAAFVAAFAVGHVFTAVAFGVAFLAVIVASYLLYRKLTTSKPSPVEKVPQQQTSIKNPLALCEQQHQRLMDNFNNLLQTNSSQENVKKGLSELVKEKDAFQDALQKLDDNVVSKYSIQISKMKSDFDEIERNISQLKKAIDFNKKASEIHFEANLTKQEIDKLVKKYKSVVRYLDSKETTRPFAADRLFVEEITAQVAQFENSVKENKGKLIDGLHCDREYGNLYNKGELFQKITAILRETKNLSALDIMDAFCIAKENGFIA